jgi:hypothetical protein
MFELITLGSGGSSLCVLVGLAYLTLGWFIPSLFKREEPQKVLQRDPYLAAKIHRLRAMSTPAPETTPNIRWRNVK